MKNKDQNIDVEKVLSEIKTNLKNLRHDLETGDFTNEEWDTIQAGLEEAEFKAYKIKMGTYLDQFSSSSPDIPFRDVMIQLLTHVRPDASSSMLAKVTGYILEQWEIRQLKVAA